MIGNERILYLINCSITIALDRDTIGNCTLPQKIEQKKKMERLALIFRHRIDPYFRIYNDSDDDLNRHRSTVIRAGPIRFSTTYRRSIMIFRLSKKILRHDTCQDQDARTNIYNVMRRLRENVDTVLYSGFASIFLSPKV